MPHIFVGQEFGQVSVGSVVCSTWFQQRLLGDIGMAGELLWMIQDGFILLFKLKFNKASGTVQQSMYM